MTAIPGNAVTAERLMHNAASFFLLNIFPPRLLICLLQQALYIGIVRTGKMLATKRKDYSQAP